MCECTNIGRRVNDDSGCGGIAYSTGLNTTSTGTNLIKEAIDSLMNALTSLHNYVDSYINALDIVARYGGPRILKRSFIMLIGVSIDTPHAHHTCLRTCILDR